MQPQSPRSSSPPPVRARNYTSTTPLRAPLAPTLNYPYPQQSAAPQSGRLASRQLHVSPRVASLILIVAGLVVIGGLGFWRVTTAKPTLPRAVAQQLSFGVYFPTTKSSLATIDNQTISYQAGGGLLSYTARLQDGTTISVNQQATPVSFVDIPQTYDKLVASLQPYSSFESINGKVALTHPKELSGSQSAVMNAKGTLLFARPSRSLSDTQWRQLFNGFFAQQIPASK